MSSVTCSPDSHFPMIPQQAKSFKEYAKDWWDPYGAMRPLHALQEVRLRYLRNRLQEFHPAWVEAKQNASPVHEPWSQVSVLDIGCGGGLVSEALARLGAKVTGLDPSEELINVARDHADATGTKVTYKVGSLPRRKVSGTFDVVLFLEVLEHIAVQERPDIMRALRRLTTAGGIVIASTINRTPRSGLLAISLAERVLRWLPRGTHDYSLFIKPGELAQLFRQVNLKPVHSQGVVWRGAWTLRDQDSPVNYFMTACASAA